MIQPSSSRLKDPIHHKIIFLMVMLVVLGVVLVGMEEAYRHVTLQQERASANQSACGNLAKVLLGKLLLIERDFIILATTRDPQVVENTSKSIRRNIEETKNLLQVLQHGGTFNNVLQVNFKDISDVTEQIIYTRREPSPESEEVLALSAMLVDIEQFTNDLISATYAASGVAESKNGLSAVKDVSWLLKQMYTRLQSARQIADRIFYNTNMEIRLLRESQRATRLRFADIRYVVLGAILVFGIIVCLRSLKQIGRILSERETYAQELRGSNQFVEQILEALPVGMALINADHKILQINKAALDLLNEDKPENILGHTCTNIFCSIETEQCPLNAGSHGTYSNETYLRVKSGINPAVLRKAIVLPLRGEQMVLETFVDISDRKRAEQSLIENQHFINKILAAATVGIVVVDTSTHTIVEANPAAVNMFGTTKDKMAGTACHQWICSSTPGKCPVTDLGQQLENAACEIKTSDGRTIPIIKNVATTILNGRMHLVESFIDITLLKQAEEKVRQLNDELEQRVIERTAQLEKANHDLRTALNDLKETQSRLLQSEKMASIGQLAAGVAHEINNPVGFVKSNLHVIDEYRTDLMRLTQSYEALNQTLVQNPVDQAAVIRRLGDIATIRTDIDLDYIMGDFNDVVAESTEGLARVTKIVGDLKNFAHLDTNEVEWADLNACIESTLNIVWNELKYRAEVIKDLGNLPEILCYPQRINQVLMNILINAGQAIRENGRITIKTRAENECVVVTISDTGIGIAPEHLNKIFDPFFTTKEVGKGTGLGLNVAYNIVQTHKGRIEVESTVGQGTTFVIHLPVEPDFDETPIVK